MLFRGTAKTLSAIVARRQWAGVGLYTRMIWDAELRPSCSPATRPGASPPTSPSYRSCCAAVGHQKLPAAFSGPARGLRRRRAIRKLTGGMAGETRWTSALNPSWPTFSRSRAKTLTRPRRGAGRSRRLRGSLPGAGKSKRMKDKAAHACRALCRARVAEELQRRRGTRILALSIIDRQQER